MTPETVSSTGRRRIAASRVIAGQHSATASSHAHGSKRRTDRVVEIECPRGMIAAPQKPSGASCVWRRPARDGRAGALRRSSAREIVPTTSSERFVRFSRAPRTSSFSSSTRATDPRPRTRSSAFRSDRRLRYVRSKTRGKGAALNEGLRLAHGDVLVCTDDDCEAEPGWVGAMATVFEEAPSAAVGVLPRGGSARTTRLPATSRVEGTEAAAAFGQGAPRDAWHGRRHGGASRRAARARRVRRALRAWRTVHVGRRRRRRGPRAAARLARVHHGRPARRPSRLSHASAGT